MLRKAVLVLLLGGTLLSALNVYAQDDGSDKKKAKPPSELQQ
jgi:hypothetical protein